MKKIYFSICFTYLCFTIFSQTNYSHGFLNYLGDSTEINVSPNYKAYRQQIHKKYDTLFNNKAESNEFAKILIEELRSHFENGNIYTNWPYAQGYLNKVFDKIIPGANTDSINIKIIRSTDANAFMTATGQAYITVGFLANALSEAEIASTLGHEYGHYINDDGYKRFKEYLKNKQHQKVGSMFAGYGGNIYKLISRSNMYKNFKDMERNADDVSAELNIKANYNLLARLNVLKRYKLIENNNEKNKDYHRRFGFYFRDHPPTEERINSAQKAANKSDTINTKYFQIDEESFQKIKLQAVDECINLFLQQQEYEDCIELCYRQLLFYPNDEFYLFYLNEALRRYLIINPNEGDKLFITGQYTTYTKYIPKSKLPLTVISDKQIKPTDLRISQTIFYHYEYLELANKDRLLVQLPVNELTQTDTLEFITNKDALAYFISRQEKLKQSSVSWVKNCMANTIEDVDIHSSEPFLNRYNAIKNDVLSCATKAETNTSLPCALIRAGYYGRSSFITRSDFNSDSLAKQSKRFLKAGLETPFAYFNIQTLKLSEKNALLNVIGGMADILNDNSQKKEKIRKTNLPLTSLAPEILSVLNKYKLQQLFVVVIQITDGMSVTPVGIPLSYSIKFSIYYIDFKKGFISHTIETNNLSGASDLDTKIKSLNQYLPLLRN